MADFIEIDFESDPDALSQLSFDYLQTVIPNWTPAEGNLDVWMIRAVAEQTAELQDLAATIPTTIFRWAGANLFSLPPLDAIPATAKSTWTLSDSLGHTIPDGTTVGITTPDGNTVVAFQVVGDVIVPNGSSSTAADGVLLQAVVPGKAANGLSGAFTLIDSLSFVNSIAVTTQSGGGIDAEEDSAYLSRLRIELQLLAPRPIVPEDFSAMVRNIPGVARSVSLDGYDPTTGTSDNPRTISVAAVDELGNPVDVNTKNDMAALLEGNREVNFLIYIIDPVINFIDVTYEVEAEPGFDDMSDIVDRVNIALTNYLNSATWGLPQSGDQVTWLNDTVVRYLSVAAVIRDVPGVWHVVDLNLGIAGGAQTPGNVVMSGVVPMPSPGTFVGTADPAGSV